MVSRSGSLFGHLCLRKLLAVHADCEGPVVEVVVVVAVVQGLHRLDLAAENVLLEDVTDPFELILRVNRSRDRKYLI